MSETDPQRPERPPGSTTPNAATPPTAARPTAIFLEDEAPRPRPNFGSMLFLTAFFFFMSNNNTPVSDRQVTMGPNGELVPRITELDLARSTLAEWQGVLNGTQTSNYTAPPSPPIEAATLLPTAWRQHHGHEYWTNITGFYRDAHVHPLELADSAVKSGFWADAQVPERQAGWNETRAEALRGTWAWANTTTWSMNLRERPLAANLTTYDEEWDSDEWSWIKGSLTLSASPGPHLPGETAKQRHEKGEETLEYNFYGLHYLPNGTYNLYGLPDGKRIDIRHLAGMWEGEWKNATSYAILGELERELSAQMENLLLAEAKDDPETVTSCPLLIHLALPHLPHSTHAAQVKAYEQELRHPSGLKWSLPKPPNYWDGLGLGGVAVADECGWALGIEGGTGVSIDDFWRKTINYAAYATLSQLLVLLLMIRQMEATRTPSTLAKVSLWTIIMMAILDSWVFSSHVIVGIMTDTKASLPLIVPGFLCLCSAVLFGPRYAVIIHRIQAPESLPARPATTAPAAVQATPSTSEGDGAALLSSPTAEAEPTPSRWQRVSDAFNTYPALKFLAGGIGLMIYFRIALRPTFIPFLLFSMYSFWVPQIWRNATRGSSGAMSRSFVLGTAAGRMALPIYVFACPDNVLFVSPSPTIWLTVLWQAFQIAILFAQERLGPAFFLPKSMQPPESYNYHPYIPPADSENPASAGGEEKTCSICMEEVNTSPAGPTETILGLGGQRRSYAVAPCHHLFHTKCLSQWLAIKTICPLCKRSLPPL